MKVPKLLAAALTAVERPLRTAARAELRRRAASRERARLRHNRRRRVGHIRVRQAKLAALEAADLAQATALARVQRERMADSLRIGGQFVRQMERQGKIRAPGAPILKRPRYKDVMPRKVRKDVGQRHHFRGRPGYPLRPEDLYAED